MSTIAVVADKPLGRRLSEWGRRVLPLRTLLRIAAARAGAAGAHLRPVRERVYIAAPRRAQLDGNLLEIEQALLALAEPPVIVYELKPGPLPRLPLPLRLLISLLRTVRQAYRVASSRLVLVDDYFFPIYPIGKRAGTTIVQVWHGCGAFKRFGRATLDAEWGVDPIFLARVPIHANYDLALVSSASIAPIYAEAFGMPLERVSARYGIPRTDALADPARRERTEQRVRAALGLTDDRRTILYAPTFRGRSVGSARAPLDLDIAALARDFGATHRLVLRLHPFVRQGLEIPAGCEDFVVDASSHPDANEVLMAADLLVSDYSSLIYEYALLGRPMAFFAPDLESYERERGFFFDYRSGVPGPVVATTAELAAWIRDGDHAAGAARARDFARVSFDVADGRATARLVEGVLLPTLRRTPDTLPGVRGPAIIDQ